MIRIQDRVRTVEHHLNGGDQKADSRSDGEEVNGQIVLDVQLEIAT